MAKAIWPFVASEKGSGILTTISGQNGHRSGNFQKVVSFRRNGWSASTGKGGQVEPDSVVRFPRKTQKALIEVQVDPCT